MKQEYKTAVKSVLFSILLLATIFLGATFLWICITPYTFEDFPKVLSLVLKNAGAYSVLLVGVVITIFFQVYSKERELEKEDKIKIEEVGYYTLAFARETDEYREEFKNDKLVVEIMSNDDFKQNLGNTSANLLFSIKFLTSHHESTNLKNIMAFGDKYFKENKMQILKDYYGFCEKVEFASPLYCSTKPTCELINNGEADINRYFWLSLQPAPGKECKYFWISAVTEGGFLLFIHVKVRIESVVEAHKITLLQQTTYYRHSKELYPLFR